MVPGEKVSYIESLDYEINENNLFKHGWRSRSRVEVLQCIFLNWLLAFLVVFLTGIIGTLINLSVENIAGSKLLAFLNTSQEKGFSGKIFLEDVSSQWKFWKSRRTMYRGRN